MPLCERCTSAVQKLRPQAAGELLRGEITQLPPDVKLILPKLQLEAFSACWLCLRFVRWLEIEDPTMFNDWISGPLSVTYETHTRSSADLPKLILPFAIVIVPDGSEHHETLFDAEVNFCLAQEYTEPMTAHSKQHEATSIDFKLIKSWVEQCSRNHKKCWGESKSWYPTRLLHLDQRTGKVKLILTKSRTPKGQYMTLSHRWGPQSYTLLEPSTMAQLQENVDVSSLPQVFQDAIGLAHHLGIHYLWIDALCIQQRQSGNEDWKVEAPRMGKVYSNAFINVSATLSSDGTGSLLQERTWGHLLPSTIDLDINGETLEYYAYDGDLWYDNIDNAPLSKRGWVFQERFLARRVLHFGQNQMGWECSELTALEMFPDGLPQKNLHTTKAFTNHQLEKLKGTPHTTTEKTFVDLWHNLVSEYTKCELTEGSDKVVAFMGVAEVMSSYIGAQHSASMLQTTLVYDLAWWRSSEDRAAYPISMTSSRAPSWSWASVDGEINFPDTIGGVKLKYANVWEFSKIPSDSNLLADAESIRAEAICLPFRIKCSDGNIESVEVIGLSFPTEEEYGIDSQCSFLHLECSVDEAMVLARQGKTLLLPLFVTAYWFYGIALAKIRGLGAHRRLGAFRLALMRDKITKDTPHILGMDVQGRRSTKNSRSQRDPWIIDQRPEQSSQDGPSEVSWNQDTLKLMYNIRDKQRARPIEIY